MLVLIDVIILLVYTIVEGVQRNLTAIQVPNRENLRNVEGVGWYIHDLKLSVSFTSVTLLSESFLCTSKCAPSPCTYFSFQEREVVTLYFTYICSSTARDIFLGVLYGYKMVLQVIALVFAFATRKVKVKGLDDSKYIAAAIYVTSIVLAVIIVATYSLKDFVNAFAILLSTGFLIGTTVILGLVFVPKVRNLGTSANASHCEVA